MNGLRVKYHTKEKHRLLGDYISICCNVHKNKPHSTFHFVDLFAGDGLCEYKLRNHVEKWEGTPLLAARIGNDTGIHITCHFNEKDKENLEKLQKRLSKYSNMEIHFSNEDANIYYNEILKNIPKNSHSLFFLDPHAHSQLKWGTIEGIANHYTRKKYKGKFFWNRPELMINLMTYSMQKSYKGNPTLIDECLGTSNWRDKVRECKEKGAPVHRAFYGTAIEQIKQIYDEEPFDIEVNKIRTKNLLYHLIFVSNHPLANKIFKDYSPYIDKHRKELSKEHVQICARSSGIKLLDDF